MALPQLTPEQRAAALAKAAEVRQVRAKIKDDIKSGTVTIADVLERGKTDAAIGKMRVSALLVSLPKVGKVRAGELMESLGIAETRRVAGLGDRQRASLIDIFS